MVKRISKLGKALLMPLLMVCIITAAVDVFPMNVIAKDKTESISGKLYEFEKGSKYEFSTAATSKTTTSNFGSLTIAGNMKSITAVNGVNAYEISDGNVAINYTLGTKYIGEDSSSWYLIDDKSKKVDSETLDEDILKGAILIQTSLDGQSWVTDKALTNVAANEEYDSNIYTSKDIQQVNGCYYRIIVAYYLERVSGSSKYLFINVDNKEYLKCAEVYQFYLVNNSENISNGTSATATPRKELGEVVNAGKDTGFANTDALTSKDPHYGWTIGTFFVNGYTRETKDSTTGIPIFLKNVGDRVTLWFNLKQDINKLNGNDDLIINEDKDGYDQYFQTDKTNMRHGTLIIRYTDYEGVKHDPVIYTDYLAANARTGANTKVELFEEGDYEVALDYEIADTSGIVDSYTNYRIFFKFQIRNGNCMVYPFDITSGAELQDNAITENGFKLDMAKSRYLTIDVSRIVLVNGTNGRTEDVRFNRPAKDGDQYKDEGIYRFNVHNLYTGEDTTKTIYVGTDPFLRAMSVTHLSVGSLEDKLAEGYTIGTDGKLIDPPVIEEEIVEEVEPETDVEAEKVDSEEAENKTDNNVTETKEDSSVKEESQSPSTGKENIQKEDNSTDKDTVVEASDANSEVTEKNGVNLSTYVLITVVVVLAFAVLYFAKKSSKQRKNSESIYKNVEAPEDYDEKEGDEK